MPRPKLAPSTKKTRKVITPSKPAQKLVPAKPKKEILEPAIEELGLREILVDEAYKSVLVDIRKELSAPERVLSQTIHARGMDTLNDWLVKTLFRPSPLLFASFITFLTVLVSVFFSKTLGYSYNYLTFLFFFVFGYILELLIEIVVSLFR